MDELRKWMEAFADALRGVGYGGFVFGEGAMKPRVALVGEAPGEFEARAGRPFVGKAGRRLDESLGSIGLTRGEVYVTNAVKIRPTRATRAGGTANRSPTAREVEAFAPWLYEELRRIAPERIVTLGNVSLRSLCGAGVSVGEARGAWREWEGFRVFPMYHPAALIYNRKLEPIFLSDWSALAADLGRVDG